MSLNRAALLWVIIKKIKFKEAQVNAKWNLELGVQLPIISFDAISKTQKLQLLQHPYLSAYKDEKYDCMNIYAEQIRIHMGSYLTTTILHILNNAARRKPPAVWKGIRT